MTIALALAAVGVSSRAEAAPEKKGASGSFSTKDGGSARSSGGGIDWPELVVGGNAVTFQAPFQIGAAGYLPKARFAFSYERQIRREHWVHVGAAFIADRGDFENFRMKSCGLEQADGSVRPGACVPGSVLGVDLFAGYTYKFFLQDRPWLVPFVRGTIGWSWFKLPSIGPDSSRLQSRTKSWTLNLRPGGGIRFFPWSFLGFGSDINIPIGFLVHTDIPDGGAEDKQGGFLLGFEILPLCAEYRF